MSVYDKNKSTGFPVLGPLPDLSPVASHNLDQVENLLRTKGILAFHIRHALDPDRETLVAGLNIAHPKKEYTHTYYDVRPIRVVPQNFNVRDTLTVMGMYSTGSVMMNVDGNYLDGSKERVFMSNNDLILLNPTITELNRELFTFDGTARTKLRYRIVEVDYLATGDIQNGNGIRYLLDQDFVITEDGYLNWLDSGQKPKKGQVVTIVYYYRPIFIISSVPHSLRVLPDNRGSGNPPRMARYFPQLVLLEYSTVRDGPEQTTDWFNLPELSDWQQWLEVK